MTSRREALYKIFQGSAAMVTGGLAWGTLASGAGHATMALRPPGAATEKEFSASCIKCGYYYICTSEDSSGSANMGNQRR